MVVFIFFFITKINSIVFVTLDIKLQELQASEGVGLKQDSKLVKLVCFPAFPKILLTKEMLLRPYIHAQKLHVLMNKKLALHQH